VHYTAGIINWRKDELEAMDRKTRKMMTIYNSLHPRADEKAWQKRTNEHTGVHIHGGTKSKQIHKCQSG